MAEWKQETVTLVHPIEVDGNMRSQVTVREPTLEGLEQIEELDLTNESRLQRDEAGNIRTNARGQRMYVDPTYRELRKVLAILSDMPHDALGRMHRQDFTTLVGVAFPLLNGPESDADVAPGPDGSKV